MARIKEQAGEKDWMEYEVIQKKDIPPELPRDYRGAYGKWKALSKTLRLLNSSEAVKMELGGQPHRYVMTSLHKAARRENLNVSAYIRDGSIYVIVRKNGPPPPDRKLYPIVCVVCHTPWNATRKDQTICLKTRCRTQRDTAKQLLRSAADH